MSPDGYIRPVEINKLFLPPPEKAGFRHGRNEGKDPHDEHDELELRRLILKATPADRSAGDFRTQDLRVGSDALTQNLASVANDGNTPKIVNKLPNEVFHPFIDNDNITSKRQEKIKEVFM